MNRIDTNTQKALYKTAKRGRNKGLFKSLALALPGALLILGLSAAPAAAAVCKSQAYEKKDAVSFCDGKLGCTKKGLVTSCSGKPRRWICRCVKPKPTGGQNNIEGLLLDSESSTPAMLSALAGALDGFNGQQQSAVATPYIEHAPSALEAAQQANHDRERDLATAARLDRERKRDKGDHQGYQNTMAGETGDSTGIFQAGDETETDGGDTGTVSETGDSTGIFQTGDNSGANLGAFSNALGRYAGDNGCGFTALELLVNGGLILAYANGQIPLSISGSQATGQNMTLFGVTGHQVAVLFIRGVLQLTARHPCGGNCSSQFERL